MTLEYELVSSVSMQQAFAEGPSACSSQALLAEDVCAYD